MALCTLVYFILYPSTTTLQISTNGSANWNKVTDANDGGNSFSKVLNSDKSLKFKWKLAEGFNWPYAGVKTLLSKKPLEGVSIAGFQKVHFKMTSSHDDGLRIILKSPDAKRTKPNSPTSYYYHQKEVFPQRYDGELIIDLKEFRIPTWWKEKYKVNLDYDLKALGRLQEIELLNGYSSAQNKETQIEISSIYFSKPNYLGAKISGLFLLILAFLTGLKLFNRIQLANQQLKETTQSNIKALKDYKPQQMSDSDTILYEELIAYLKENYSNPDLSLQSTSTELKMTTRKTSSLLNQKLNNSFKGYLNQLRLTEAKRLLKETDSNISEISFSVGYNNPSHFNRVFKEMENCSPKGFRKAD